MLNVPAIGKTRDYLYKGHSVLVMTRRGFWRCLGVLYGTCFDTDDHFKRPVRTSFLSSQWDVGADLPHPFLCGKVLSYLAISDNDIFVAAQFVQAHRPACMDAISRNTDFRSQAKFKTIGKPG